MLSALSITLRGAIGGRLLREMGASLRGLMELAMALATRPTVRPQVPCQKESCQDELLVSERAVLVSLISGSEGKYRFSHNILGWLNLDRNNWSGETTVRIPSLI